MISTSTNNPARGIHVSNLLTYLSVATAMLGLYGTHHFLSPHFLGLTISLCFIFDLFDGKFARLFKNRPEVAKATGGQLDSLADAISFGFFPVLGLFIVNLQLPSAFLILTGLFFVITNLTRLAYFNVYSGDGNFIGLPTTLAGLFLSLALNILPLEFMPVVLLILAVLMVAPFKLKRPSPLVMLLLTLIAVINIAVHGYRSYMYYQGLVS